jgi:hypothetical protein
MCEGVQSNLKFARQPPVTPLLTVDFRGADLHKQLEHAALQRLFEHFQADSYSSDGVVRQPLSSPYTKVSLTRSVVCDCSACRATNVGRTGSSVSEACRDLKLAAAVER